MRKKDETEDMPLIPSMMRAEIGAAMRIISGLPEKVRTAMDFGFSNPRASLELRKLNGYWMTVESSEQARNSVVAHLPENTVVSTGRQGELPFEDLQFDAIVAAREIIPAAAGPAQEAVVRELHRVLKTGGILVATFNAQSFLGSGGECTTEREIFDLLRGGFDVLGFRYARLLFRGRIMTVCARRKGWRNHKPMIHTSSTPVSDALLFCTNHRHGPNVPIRQIQK